LDTQKSPLENPLAPYSSVMLSVRQLIEFGTEGFIVVRGLVPEALLAAADQEIDELLDVEPCPEDVRGKHSYFKSPSTDVAADATLRDSAAMDLAEQLVAPHRRRRGRHGRRESAATPTDCLRRRSFRPTRRCRPAW